MEQVQTTATVTQLVGKAFVLDANGEKIALQQGDTLLPGTIIMTESGSQVVVQGPDFKLELNEDSLTEIPSQPLTTTNAPAILDATSEEVAALQAAILEGLDPTQAFEATAAGIPGAGALPEGTGGQGSGNGGFVQVMRTGNDRIAEAGFDTQVAPLVFDELPEFLGDNLLGADVRESAEAPETPVIPDIPNQAPVALSFNIEGYEDSRGPLITNDLSPIVINLSGTDADGTIQYFIINSLPDNGTFEVNGVLITAGSIISAGDELIFIPKLDWSGVTEFEYQAVDNQGAISTPASVGITVLPVSDVPIVTAEINGSSPSTQTIDGASIPDNNKGVVKGFGYTLTNNNVNDQNFEFSSEISAVKPAPNNAPAPDKVSGFGVAGNPSNNGGYGKEIDPNQTLTVTFDSPVTELTAQFSWLSPTEYAKYIIYGEDGKTVIGEGIIKGITDLVDPAFTIKAENGELIGSIDFTAAGKDDIYDGQVIGNHSSDFLIQKITFPTTSYKFGVTASPTDTDYSETIVSITVETPVGAQLSHGTQGDTTNGKTLWDLPISGADFTSVTNAGVTTLTSITDPSYVVTINAQGVVSIAGLSITTAGQVPPAISIIAQAQDSLGNYTAPTAAGDINVTFVVAPLDEIPNGLTVTGSDIPVLEGNNVDFNIQLDSAVNNETVLRFTLTKGAADQADAADIGTPVVTINGVPQLLVVHNGNTYSVTVPLGVQNLVVSVPALVDGTFEGNELFTLNATLIGENTSGAPLAPGITNFGTGIITDLNGVGLQPVLTVEAGADIAEGAVANFRVTQDKPVNADTTLNLSFGGQADLTDLDLSSLVVIVDGVKQSGITVAADGTFNVLIPANGAGTVIISVKSIADGVFEGPESLTLTAQLTGTTASGTAVNTAIVSDSLIIADLDSVPVLTVKAEPDIAEGAVANFTVTQDKPVNADTTLNLTFGGEADLADLDLSSLVVTVDDVKQSGITVAADGTFNVLIPANGTGTVIISVQSIADGVFEGPESLTLTAQLTGSTATGTSVATNTATDSLNIIDVNEVPIIEAAAKVKGPEDSANIEIKLSAVDTDGTVKSFVINSLPANGLLYLGTVLVTAGMTITAVGGEATLKFVPTADWSGKTEFNYHAVDNADGISIAATANIEVTPVTDIPELRVNMAEVSNIQKINTGNVHLYSDKNIVDGSLKITAFTEGKDDTGKFNNTLVGAEVSNVKFGDKLDGVDGFGVVGQPSRQGDDSEIDNHEVIRIDFGSAVENLGVKFSWLSQEVSGEKTQETAKYTIFDKNGNIIGTGTVKGETDQIDPVHSISDKFPNAEIHRVEFTGLGEHDDFLIHEISYSIAGKKTYQLEIAATTADIDGSEKITAIQVKIPSSAELSIGTTDSANDKDGMSIWTLPLNNDRGYHVVEDGLGGFRIEGLTVTVKDGIAPIVEVTAIAKDGTAEPATITVSAELGSYAMGDAGDNILDGTADNDIIYGKEGDDTINGGAGNDNLYGGAGHDTINGGTGADHITGGLGYDIIDFGLNDEAVDVAYWTAEDYKSGVNQEDKITSFELGTDKLDFSDFFTDAEKESLDTYLTVVDNAGTAVIKATSAEFGTEIEVTLDGIAYSSDILEQVLTQDLLNTLNNNG